MYYLTYRPKTLEELDNSQVRDVLRNLLASKEIPHAMLFIGQKGTGKTSTARILAKSVNCLENKFAGKGESVEPCNHCPNCTAIDSSSSPDVLELDAASNRGIDEIRSLIKESVFLPMACRYRVFIIDEAHMITTDAFNALLKTLEEPPSTVLFILATTNEEKVPKTIVSRCYRVSFGSAKREDILRMLQRIVEAEKLVTDPAILELVAKHSEKSFRDTTKLLEELVIQNKLNLQDAKEYLGIRGQYSLLELIDQKTLKEALSWTEELTQSGGSVKNLIEELLEDLREALLVKSGVSSQEDEYTHLSLSDVMKLMKLFTDAYQLLKISPIDSIPLEIALVEFYNGRK
ncbi:DNA polymerase III subunit gamma/tau [Candidatus Roizmanbacteria bacterium]|nr:DNA polymerase III subunit gamma/tau [Candidatus Roizmanbacteria bacterium]